MKRKLLVGTLLVAVMTAGICSSQASAAAGKKSPQDKGCDCLSQEPGQAGERLLGKMAKELQLTAGQKAQVKVLLVSEREKLAPLREKLAEGRKQLQAAASATTFDEAAVRVIAAGQVEPQTELLVAHARVRNQINALLTPEQRIKAEKMTEKHRQKRPAPDQD